jgi:lipoprotein-anchoring transpeptidase ErfK/SrfK
VHIDIPTQRLTTLYNEKVVKVYSVSTALNGAGQSNGSGCTPTGAHYIRAKIGTNATSGSVFIGRRLTGEVYSDELGKQFPKRDWILSRILWLSGLTIGHNRLSNSKHKVDTMARYIYIHGTPDTEPMGVPKSHGCIRMRNADVIELFDWVPDGCLVFIE